MIVAYELGYDQFEPDRERIYQVTLETNFNGFTGNSSGVPAPLGKAVKEGISGLEQVVPVFQFQGDANAQVVLERESKPLVFKKQNRVVFTNPGYIQLMNLQWLAGSASTALSQPFQVVLTTKRAALYFPNLPFDRVIGEKISYNDIPVTVSGVVSDIPKQTDLQSEEFISLSTIEATSLKEQFMLDRWDDWMAYSSLYLKTAPRTAPEQLQQQLNQLFQSHLDAEQRKENVVKLNLLPLADKHFDQRYPNFDSRLAHKPTLYTLLAVAGFLLLLGCINYINLSTAQASRRAKEVGVRKTMGIQKKQLIGQFLTETFLITGLATLVSIVFIPFLLKLFADFIPPSMGMSFFWTPPIILFLLCLLAGVALLAGLYPAFILSGYRPVLVLKNNPINAAGQNRQMIFRKALTISQFVVAQFFLIATVMVSKQIYYVLHADMGFRKDAILTFNTPRDSIANHHSFLLEELKALPGVELVSRGFFSPATAGGAFANITYHNGKEEIKPSSQVRWGDSAFFDVYQLKLVAGRKTVASDSITELIVNKVFTQMMGLQHPQEAVGRFLNYNGRAFPIVGVMADFHEHSLRAGIGAMVFANQPGDTFHVRLKDNIGQWPQTIAQMEQLYKSLYPEEDFNYQFVDEQIAQFYEAEQATATLLKWATGLAIAISCLGLLGLVLFTVNSRSKEVSIRKVLGASVTQILTLLSRDFVKLVLLAFLITIPLAWLASYKWLENFAYKTEMTWWLFVLSGFSMLLLTLVVLSIHTIKAALENPVNRLRDE